MSGAVGIMPNDLLPNYLMPNDLISNGFMPNDTDQIYFILLEILAVS